MEDNNLELAPTKQELIDAGFIRDTESFFNDKDCNNFVYTKTISHNLDVNVFFVKNKINEVSITAGNYFLKSLEPTKAAINAEFKHFNKQLPQWEKAQPKVGEVWKNDFYVFLIIKDAKSNVLKLEGEIIEGANWINCETGNYANFQFDKFTKVADSLKQYYKEKFINEHMKNK